jgi:GH35 family endo-1,4-beta-xylanase
MKCKSPHIDKNNYGNDSNWLHPIVKKIYNDRVKHSNVFLLILLALTVSCVEEEFDSGIVPEKPQSVVESEYLNSFDVLKSYVSPSESNFKIGANVSSNEFLEKGNKYSLVKTNFNEIASRDLFTTGMVMQNDGSLNFMEVEKVLDEAKLSGLDIFGYALCWHKNQNGTFLNGRYGAKEFDTPSFPNVLDKSGLEDGSFSNWDVQTSNGGTIEKSTYNADDAIKISTGAGSANPEDVKLTSPVYAVSETTYEITTFIMASKAGTGRFTFEGLESTTLERDWLGNGVKAESFTLNPGWNKISFQIDEFVAEDFRFSLELGYTPEVDYYVHINGLSMVDLNSEFYNPDEFFLEAEDGAVGSKWQVFDDEDASGGKYASVPDNNNSALITPGNEAENNIVHTFNVITPGEYKFWVRVKHPSAEDDSYHFKVDENDWYTFNNQGSSDYGWFPLDTFYFDTGEHLVTTSWREDGAQIDKLYFTLTDQTPSGVGTPAAKVDKLVLDLEAAEKVNAVGSTFENWISSVVTEMKDDVNAWVVVSDPIDDDNPSDIKTGSGQPSENEFYWQDYLGKDYAVTAFKTARANANDGDLLFISDYGLHSNIDKCQGLIDYVDYIEGKGAAVDGIAAQLNLTFEAQENDIATMFKMLANTGKLIKVAQLKVEIPANIEVTNEILQQQADLYKSVVNQYYLNVPEIQQYGIEIAGLADGADDANGLWTESFNRKPSYAGFAEGLGAN